MVKARLTKQAQKEREQELINWMLESDEPTPLAFFRLTDASEGAHANRKYSGLLIKAMCDTSNETILHKLNLVLKKYNNGNYKDDWQNWKKQKTKGMIVTSIVDANYKVHEAMNCAISEKKDVDEGEVETGDEEEDGVDKYEEGGEEEQAQSNALLDIAINQPKGSIGQMSTPATTLGNQKASDHDIRDNFKECVEAKPTSCRRRVWTLLSGTDVEAVLAEYVKTIPTTQKCLNPAYWNILDLTGDHPEIKCLFSAADWAEMVASFEQEVKLKEAEVSDDILHFFDELEKVTNGQKEDLITAIEQISPEVIEKVYNVSLSDKDREDVAAIRRAVIAYAENLRGVDLPVSEAAFDNAFPNMLARRFLDPDELKLDVGEIACWASSERRNVGRSVLLRARIGQKCDIRGVLKRSIDNFEPLIGLRSGGLPVANRRKIFEDRIDLAVTLRDVVCRFFESNSKAPDDDLHGTFVIGIQSWGWVHEVYGMDCKGTNILRFGRLRRTKLPNTTMTLPCLEEFYVLMTDLMATLKGIREHVNHVALMHSRVRRKRKSDKTLEVGGCFGAVPVTPVKKARTYDNDE